MRSMTLSAAFALTLATATVAAPIDAQGRGRGPDNAGATPQGRGAGASEAKPQGRGADKSEAQARGRGASETQAQSRGRGAERADAQPRGNPQSRGRAAAPAQGNRGTAQSSGAASRGRGAAQGRAADRSQAGDIGRGQAAVGRGRGTDLFPRSADGRVDPPAPVRGVGRGRFVRDLTLDELRPSVRGFAGSSRAPERLAAVAVALAHARGVSDEDIVITRTGDRVRLVNRERNVLLDMDDNRARNVGWWDMVVLPERTTGNAPSFCRSGEGHPVWGRQWCLDKGFGLGTLHDIRWSRAIDPRDIVIRTDAVVRRESPVERLTREVLEGILGETAFSRMALHALTLGLSEPLTGRWLGEPASTTRVLLVESGTHPVYEVVDLDGDGRADMLIGAVRPW